MTVLIATRSPAIVLALLQVKEIIVRGKGDKQQAVGVRLADGRVFRGKAVVSNATRWDTFEKLLAHEEMPESERLFRQASSAHSCTETIWQTHFYLHCVVNLFLDWIEFVAEQVQCQPFNFFHKRLHSP